MSTLSHSKQDIEARLGFRSGKFTNPNKALSFILGASLLFAFYGCLKALPMHVQSHPFVAIFTERGFIPYITMGAFFWGLAMLWVKSRKMGTQKGGLKFLVDLDLPNSPNVCFSVGTAPTWLRWLNSKCDSVQEYIPLNRLRIALASLGNLEDPASLQSIVNSNAEADEVQIENSYSFISTLLYAIPILGFIGTVLGLGAAIGGFGQTLSEGTENMDGLIESLQGVTAGLSVAFDTTLLALIAALILQIYCALVKARESSFLEDCNFFFQNEFFPLLRKAEPGVVTTESEAASGSEPVDSRV